MPPLSRTCEFGKLPCSEHLPDGPRWQPEHGSEARTEMAVTREPQVRRQRGEIIGALGKLSDASASRRRRRYPDTDTPGDRCGTDGQGGMASSTRPAQVRRAATASRARLQASRASVGSVRAGAGSVDDSPAYDRARWRSLPAGETRTPRLPSRSAASSRSPATSARAPSVVADSTEPPKPGPGSSASATVSCG